MSHVNHVAAAMPALTPNEAALHALAAMHEQGSITQRIAERLLDLLEQQARPADMETVRLTAATPVKTVTAFEDSASLSVLNPSSATVGIGIGGNMVRRTVAGAWVVDASVPSCPPSSLLTLPVGGADVELGASDADVAAGDAVLFLFRYSVRQQAYLEALP